MLTLSDSLSQRRQLGRRYFMQIGGAALGSLALPMLNSRQAQGGGARSPVTGKSVICLFQQGGPSQLETFDPKVDAPAEIASVGGEIPTSVPGIRFGSSLPQLAQHAHRMAVVRNYQTNTGHGGVAPLVSKQLGDASIGSAYARVAGVNHPETGLPNSMFMIPQSIDGDQKTLGERFGKFDAVGGLGKAYAPFVPGGKGPLQEAMNLTLPRDRFDNRRNLLKSLDGARRQFDAVVEMDGLSGIQAQALDLVLKGVASAFDLSKEDPRTVARYDTSQYYNPRLWSYAGDKTRNNIPWYTAHTKTLGKMLLLARRLCEAGCGFITIHSEFVWDFHADSNNVAVAEGKQLVIEPFDHAVSAFIEDCEDRGLSDDILLVCCGEMGRTPRINKNGGRDHWPKLAPLMLYGGGLTAGQDIGRSTRDAGEAVGVPQTPDDLLATIFHTLFDYAEARLIPDLPTDLKRALASIEKNPGVLAIR
ncbi:DUF1501 domain-containing protein [Lignipirellula cremea]|uniref:DUF1501 domain-containing protein n=1 Tax=Lignipirellula cremea TaxID=2528010 RepID=A0A518E0R6_9BACT|nr:DUF1501 domain-containing protein [Lignipirellula cremea]QDU97677.1 hypothetical protein Pla8534_55300 [Lignipirellula cremea]